MTILIIIGVATIIGLIKGNINDLSTFYNIMTHIVEVIGGGFLGTALGEKYGGKNAK